MLMARLAVLFILSQAKLPVIVLKFNDYNYFVFLLSHGLETANAVSYQFYF